MHAALLFFFAAKKPFRYFGTQKRPRILSEEVMTGAFGEPLLTQLLQFAVRLMRKVPLVRFRGQMIRLLRQRVR